MKSIGRDSDGVRCRLLAVGLADEGDAAAKHQVATSETSCFRSYVTSYVTKYATRFCRVCAGPT